MAPRHEARHQRREAETEQARRVMVIGANVMALNPRVLSSKRSLRYSGTLRASAERAAGQEIVPPSVLEHREQVMRERRGSC
jgi:hypothetical protein